MKTYLLVSLYEADNEKAYDKNDWSDSRIYCGSARPEETK